MATRRTMDDVLDDPMAVWKGCAACGEGGEIVVEVRGAVVRYARLLGQPGSERLFAAMPEIDQFTDDRRVVAVCNNCGAEVEVEGVAAEGIDFSRARVQP